MANPDILSERYATPEMNEIFSEKGKIIAERELWIAVMKAQKELGMNIPSEDIEKFEAARDDVNLDLIKEIERKTKHDVKAKIEAFVRTAGAGQHLHKGLTSRDLTDNVEQMQYRNASRLVFGRNISVLRHMIDNSVKYSEQEITARTHHQAAQPTLLGRRFSMWAEELMFHLGRFEEFIAAYPLRGIKGPVGTQFDMLTLLGSPEKVERLEKIIAEKLEFKKVLNSPGQVYPRSLDYALANHLSQLSSAPENFAKTMRLMAGYGLVNEGFGEGQTGSSAMPYKMNTRSCERICGFSEILKMYADGASRISGDQWEEGDVSCSAPRRVIGPDSFFAADGLCETALTVLNNMGTYEGEIIKEVEKYLPFMATTEILQKAVKAGAGREDAHKAIKKYAIAEAEKMRREGSSTNNLSYLIANDPVFKNAGIAENDIKQILADKEHFIGNAKMQINQVVKEAKDNLLSKYSESAQYEPRAIL